MSNKEANEFVEKLNAGLELAEKRMLQEKSMRGEDVVIYTEDKGIQHIPASQVIANNNTLFN
ncbi:MAG: ribosome recycling factor [Bacteroidales bacterium]|nr:ribosome recycling factor [Bacteroidales bacterium]